jgi:hypothetical protein
MGEGKVHGKENTLPSGIQASNYPR